MARSERLSRRRILGTGMAAAGLLAAKPARSAGALQPVRIISSSGVSTTILQQLIQAQGYLTQLGLDPTFLSVTDGTRIVDGLIGGSADICIFSGFSQVLAAIEKGGTLRVVAESLVTPDHVIYAKNPAIRKVADLKGKTIGIGPIGSLLHQMMVAALATQGIDQKDVTFANIGSAGDVFKAVVAGKVDAGPADLARFDPKYGVHILQDGVIAQLLPDFVWQASYTSTQAIAAKRDTLVRTLAAFSRLYTFLGTPTAKSAYLAAAVAAMGPNSTEEAEQEWDFMQEHHAYDPALVISEERLRYAQQLNLSTGIQKRILSYPEVVDASLARDAVALAARG